MEANRTFHSTEVPTTLEESSLVREMEEVFGPKIQTSKASQTPTRNNGKRLNGQKATLRKEAVKGTRVLQLSLEGALLAHEAEERQKQTTSTVISKTSRKPVKKFKFHLLIQGMLLRTIRNKEDMNDAILSRWMYKKGKTFKDIQMVLRYSKRTRCTQSLPTSQNRHELKGRILLARGMVLSEQKGGLNYDRYVMNHLLGKVFKEI